MMKQVTKTEKGASRSAFRPERGRFGAKSSAIPETGNQGWKGLCGPSCCIDLINLPLQAKPDLNRTNMSDVRVDANSDKPVQEQQLQHEAWQAVKPKLWLVKPTSQEKGIAIFQRKKIHAEKYNSTYSLGLESVTRISVEKFIQDKKNDREHRRGLLSAWNRNQTVVNMIAMPEDLAPKSTASVEPAADFSEWDSDDDVEMDIKSAINSTKIEEIVIYRPSQKTEFSSLVLPLSGVIKICRQIVKRDEYQEYFSPSKGLVGKAGSYYIEFAAPRGNDIVAAPLERAKDGKYVRTGEIKPWSKIATELDEESPDASMRPLKRQRITKFFTGAQSTSSPIEAEAMGAISADFMKGSGAIEFVNKLSKADDSRSFRELFAGSSPIYSPAGQGGRDLVRKETETRKKTLKRERAEKE